VAYDPLWEWALRLALLALLLSVAGRRLVLPRWRRVRAPAQGSLVPSGASAAEQLALRKSHQRSVAAEAGAADALPAELLAAMRAQPTAAASTPAPQVNPHRPHRPQRHPAPEPAESSLAERLLAKKRDGGGPRP
jgi:hypothetical protein